MHVRPLARHRPRRRRRTRGRATGVGRIAERREDRGRHRQKGARLVFAERVALLRRSEIRSDVPLELRVAASRRSAQARAGRRRHRDLRSAHVRDAAVARSAQARTEPRDVARRRERARRAEHPGSGGLARCRTGAARTAVPSQRQRRRAAHRSGAVRGHRRQGAAERRVRARPRHRPRAARRGTVFERIDAQRQAQHRPRHPADAVRERARRIRRRAARDGGPLETFSAGRPLGSQFRLHRFRSRVDQGSDRHARDRDRPRGPRHLSLLARLAHDVDSGDHDPGLTDRNLRTRESARVFDQYAHALRLDARDGPRRGRRDRRDRKHRAVRSGQSRSRSGRPRGRGHERDHGSGRRDVARPARGLRSRRLLPGRDGPTLQAVRAHDRVLDLDLALRRPHADAGALRHLHQTRGEGGRAVFPADQSRDRRRAERVRAFSRLDAAAQILGRGALRRVARGHGVRVRRDADELLAGRRSRALLHYGASAARHLAATRRGDLASDRRNRPQASRRRDRLRHQRARPRRVGQRPERRVHRGPAQAVGRPDARRGTVARNPRRNFSRNSRAFRRPRSSHSIRPPSKASDPSADSNTNSKIRRTVRSIS